MVRTRLTAAEPYTNARLEVVVDLEPSARVSDLEGALTGLPASDKTRLWLGERELDRAALLADVGICDGAVVSVGGPAREVRAGRSPLELCLVSGPDAGGVHPLPEGDTVVGGPGAGLTLSGLTGDLLLLQVGPTAVVATSLDPERPVQRDGVPLLTRVSLNAGDQLAVGPHLLAIGPAEAAASAPADVRPLGRVAVDLGYRVLEPPVPPQEPAPPRLAVLPALVPLVLGLLLGLTLSPVFLLVALASPLVIYGKRWWDHRESAMALERERAGYAQALSEFAEETAACRQAELAALRDASPDPVTLSTLAATGDGRLWSRSRQDDDRLLLRVGTSSTNATSWRVGEQPPQLLHDVPVTVPLRRAGAVAITGGPAGCRALARWLVAQAAVHHRPDDLSIWLLTSPADDAEPAADWDWLRWLPHNLGVPEQCANLIGNTEQTTRARIDELGALLAERRALGTPVPDLLLVLDGDTANLPEVAPILRDGPSLGVFALCVGPAQVPRQCRTVLSLTDDGRLTLTGTGVLPIRDVRPDLVSSTWAERVGRGLAPLRPADPAAGPLPCSLGLPELMGDLNADELWQSPSPALVGLTAAGPLALDLASTAHVLIAGADRAGMAALLQTTLLSLALSQPPDRLSLIVLGQPGELSGLPHVSAALPDLEGHDAARLLALIAAELRRREQLLDAAGAPDVGALATVPRLVLVADEIGALEDRVPGFVSRLLGLLGESSRLGIHLVVASSRPFAVPPDVVAAATVKLVLRVDDASTSQRLLGSPVAASVLDDLPGRGYARWGKGPVVPFQAADLTIAGAASSVQAQELTWERLGEPLAEASARQPVLPDLLSAMRKAGREAEPSLWLPPLPGRVGLDDLESGELALAFGLEERPADQVQATAHWDLNHGGNLLAVGNSRSGRSTLLLTLAASLARSSSSSVVHLYGLDCGGGALHALSALPHCGAVVEGGDAERAERLLARLADEVSRRRRQLAERGFEDLAAQRKGTADPLPYLVLLIDGWEGFSAGLGAVGDGRLVDTLVELLRDGGQAGLRIALTADPSVLTCPVAEVLPERLVLRLDQASDYVAAGLDPASVPATMPAGRAFRSRPGQAAPAVDAVQIALLAGDLAQVAEGLPPARGRKPFRIDALPQQVSWRGAHELTPSGPGAGLAVGGDELRLQTVNLLTAGPGFTVAGPAGSGRSTALLVLTRSLVEGGTEVCLVLPKPSPLAELRGAPGVLAAAHTADQLAAAVQRATGPMAVVVDDADQVEDAELGELLQEVLRNGRARDHALVLAGDTDRLGQQVRGFAFDARRSRSGLLLSPASTDVGDLLGVRLQPSGVFSGPVGRGLLVRSGQVQLVQVPRPD